jgi:surface carbohydrate biosynthesis protein
MKNLIIPIENQVRELDAKLLLALVCARHGFSSIIGSRFEIDLRAAAFRPAIYLAKSMTARSRKMFRILTLAGHRIAAWDEEALIHPPDQTYFDRRLDPVSITFVSDLFAWGEDNAALWRRWPDLPEDIAIHLTGNPRGDMLRPELKDFFAAASEELRREYGDFLLVNTNFSFVNPFFPDQGLYQPGKLDEEGRPLYGRAAVGMEREFVDRLFRHKTSVFDSFREMLPRLAEAFPGLKIVIRPHPNENHAVYKELAASRKNLVVLNQGNVIPWIRAARAVIHNGCTTGVEAFMLEEPAISYRAVTDEILDDGFYRLPNHLSHQAFSFAELEGLINKILSGGLGAAGGKERRQLMAGYLASQDGPLACELIAEKLAEIAAALDNRPAPDPARRLKARLRGETRRLSKKLKSFKPDSKYNPAFQRHRFPGFTPTEITRKLQQLNDSCGFATPLPQIKPLHELIYQIIPK